MPRELTSPELAKLFIAAPQHPTTSRPWGVASVFSAERLALYGWYKTEWRAKAVARHLSIAQPVICRYYSDTRCR